MSAVYNFYPQTAEDEAPAAHYSTPSESAPSHGSDPQLAELSGSASSFGAPGPYAHAGYGAPPELPSERFTAGSAPGVVDLYSKGAARGGPVLQEPVQHWYRCSGGAGTAAPLGSNARKPAPPLRPVKPVNRQPANGTPKRQPSDGAVVPIIDDDVHEQRQMQVAGWKSKGAPR